MAINKLTSKKNITYYNEIYKNLDHHYPNLDVIRLASQFKKEGKSKLLDFGFGTGQNLIHFSKDKKFDLYGLEASMQAIKKFNTKVNKNLQKNIKFLSINQNKLPYDDEFFDFIICTSVLSVLGSKNSIIKLINEFHRILKKRGRIIIDICGPRSSFSINKKEFSKNLDTFTVKNKLSFKKFLNQFHIINMGEVYFDYLNFKNHEYIAIIEK